MNCKTQRGRITHDSCTCHVSKMSIIIEADAEQGRTNDDDWAAITGPITFPKSAAKRAILNRIFSQGGCDAG